MDDKTTNRLTIFLCSLSGARWSTLEKCPTEINRYLGIGGTIFFTGLLAALSGGYAFYTAFSTFRSARAFAFVFGFIWGLMIVNLDRYIIATMTKAKTGSLTSELKIATPRFVLALIISLLIAKPLELAIFNTEIEAELTSVRQDIIKQQLAALHGRYEPTIARLQGDIEQIQSDYRAAKDRRNALETDLTKEIEGTSITKTPGDGPAAQQKRKARDLAQKEMERIEQRIAPLVASRQSELEATTLAMNTDIRSLNRASPSRQDQTAGYLYDGLLARLKALGRMVDSDISVRLTNAFIIMLAIVIETAPIIAKLMSKRGVYDEIVDCENDEILAKTRSKRDKVVLTTSKWSTSADSYSHLATKYNEDFREPLPNELGPTHRSALTLPASGEPKRRASIA
jgi:hypothetical protein